MVTCNIYVTSNEMVTVMITSYKIVEKEIEGFGRITLDNMYNTYQP